LEVVVKVDLNDCKYLNELNDCCIIYKCFSLLNTLAYLICGCVSLCYDGVFYMEAWDSASEGLQQ